LRKREEDRKIEEDKAAKKKKDNKVKDYESGFNKNKMEDLLKAKKHA